MLAGKHNKMQEPQSPEPPSIAEPIKWFAFHLTKDWAKMTKAPLGLASIVVLAIFCSWAFVVQVYVPEKNEQLATKAGYIEFLQKQLDVATSDHEASIRVLGTNFTTITNYSTKNETNFIAVLETNMFDIVKTNYAIGSITNFFVVNITNSTTRTNLIEYLNPANVKTFIRVSIKNLALKNSKDLIKKKDFEYTFKLIAGLDKAGYDFPKCQTGYLINYPNTDFSSDYCCFQVNGQANAISTINWYTCQYVQGGRFMADDAKQVTFSPSQLPLTNSMELFVSNHEEQGPKMNILLTYVIEIEDFQGNIKFQ
jgi:hypothetical protein